jgi:hypothetical protein
MAKCVGACAWVAGWLALSWAVGGCAQKADNRFFYLRGTTPKPLVQAKVPGTYALYPSDSMTPKFTIDLAAGDRYGFRKREDETVVAVARDKEIELGDRYVPSYYWAIPKIPAGAK